MEEDMSKQYKVIIRDIDGEGLDLDILNDIFRDYSLISENIEEIKESLPALEQLGTCDEQDKFEAFAKPRGWDLRKTFGQYDDRDTRFAFIGWRAHASEPPRQLLPPQSSTGSQTTRFDDFDDSGHPCRIWWEEYGQLMMSGGSRRSFIWASRGWIAREQLAEGVKVTGESSRETPKAVAQSPIPVEEEEIDETLDSVCRYLGRVNDEDLLVTWREVLAGYDRLQQVRNRVRERIKGYESIKGHPAVSELHFILREIDAGACTPIPAKGTKPEIWRGGRKLGRREKDDS